MDASRKRVDGWATIQRTGWVVTLLGVPTAISVAILKAWSEALPWVCAGLFVYVWVMISIFLSFKERKHLERLIDTAESDAKIKVDAEVRRLNEEVLRHKIETENTQKALQGRIEGLVESMKKSQSSLVRLDKKLEQWAQDETIIGYREVLKGAILNLNTGV